MDGWMDGWHGWHTAAAWREEEEEEWSIVLVMVIRKRGETEEHGK